MINTTRIPNRLTNEKSPYLQQHANNPVSWFPWGEEAFEKARLEDKPIFLSIGYSTCHWCHVMEHESFEDEEVAEILNQSFIAIKVDKEERPDIDTIYMNVCQALTGQGGWPLTILMFPSGEPFFAGTYFPKKTVMQRIGLVELLTEVIKMWKKDRDVLLENGNKILNALKELEVGNASGVTVTKNTIEEAISTLKRSFDKAYGGFGYAPKFPMPHNLMLLLRYSYFEKDQEALAVVEKTLISMYQGGIFDHIGYGFSRYSTDDKWLAPHFEKMLYDNALLAIAYLETFQFTKKQEYKMTAEKIFSYILEELTASEGGFYSAQDADSEGEEGKYYLFTEKEILHVLGEEGNVFNQFYGVTERGNFEGKNILNRIGKELDKEKEEILMPSISKLKKYRKERYQLHKDDKILTSWNALMIAAFAKGYQILQDKAYLKAAEKAYQFIENTLSKEGKLFIRYRDKEVKGIGHIDDYAFYIWALLELYEATFESTYLQKAVQYCEVMIEEFWDEKNGGFFHYAKNGEKLIYRSKEVYDGAIPSGNGAAVKNLRKLAALTGKDVFLRLYEKQLYFMAGKMEEYVAGHSFALAAATEELYHSSQLVCMVEGIEEIEKIKKFRSEHFYPNLDILVISTENKKEIEKVADFTKDYQRKEGKMTLYFCQNQTCSAPFFELDKVKDYMQ